MFSVFNISASPETFTLEKPQTPLDSMNPANTPLARRSGGMKFDDADEIDDDELNAILWAAIKGADTPMPPPVASRFSH